MKDLEKRIMVGLTYDAPGYDTVKSWCQEYVEEKENLLKMALKTLEDIRGQMPYHDGDLSDSEMKSMIQCDNAIQQIKIVYDI